MTKERSMPGVDVFGLFDTNGAVRKRKINFSLSENEEGQEENSPSPKKDLGVRRRFTMIKTKSSLAKSDP